TPDISALVDQLQSKLEPGFKSKFLVRIGQRFHSIPNEEVAYFFSESGSSFLLDKSGKKFILDQSLDQLENQLNPNDFFRINRQMIVTFKSITSIDTFFNNRLILQLRPKHDSDVLVSREKVRAFKDWLDN
ncbi:MAG: LytTR family transcriptional regulator, partial [Flavobacteriales bacterium]|nr:LytTR family transcriptional regulator [Flavobacteriales bacterium]